VEAIGGTRTAPRGIVGTGEEVADADGAGLGPIVGVGLELVGVTQAPATSDTMISRAINLIEEMFAYRCNPEREHPPDRTSGKAPRIGI
jgi:hypothetical protein